MAIVDDSTHRLPIGCCFARSLQNRRLRVLVLAQPHPPQPDVFLRRMAPEELIRSFQLNFASPCFNISTRYRQAV